MPAGNPTVSVRLPPELTAEIDRIILRSADKREAGPWTRHSFIVAAIRDKLAHMERGRRSRKRRYLSPGA